MTKRPAADQDPQESDYAPPAKRTCSSTPTSIHPSSVGHTTPVNPPSVTETTTEEEAPVTPSPVIAITIDEVEVDVEDPLTLPPGVTSVQMEALPNVPTPAGEPMDEVSSEQVMTLLFATHGMAPWGTPWNCPRPEEDTPLAGGSGIVTDHIYPDHIYPDHIYPDHIYPFFSAGSVFPYGHIS